MLLALAAIILGAVLLYGAIKGRSIVALLTGNNQVESQNKGIS